MHSSISNAYGVISDIYAYSNFIDYIERIERAESLENEGDPSCIAHVFLKVALFQRSYVCNVHFQHNESIKVTSNDASFHHFSTVWELNSVSNDVINVRFKFKCILESTILNAIFDRFARDKIDYTVNSFIREMQKK